jgi:peptidoglycan/LPS O-acetylase OafA/YrhL
LTYFFGYFSRIYIRNIQYLTIFLTLTLLAMLPFYHFHSGDTIDKWVHAIAGSLFFVGIIYFSKQNFKFSKFKIVDIIDEYSYEVYLTHQLFILGPFSLFQISDNFTFNLVVIIFAIVTSSYILKYVTNKILRI